MSTRCNVILKNEHQQIILYRHSDGYPEVAGKDLKEFVKGYQTGSMRLDPMQSAGWLIMRGNLEYNKGKPRATPDLEDRFGGWKVGAYEPTDQIHGDIEYLYIIRLNRQELEIRHASGRLIETVSFAKSE